VPTSCREEGIRNLISLLELPEVASKLTCLTLDAYKLFRKDSVMPWQHYTEAELDRQCIWIAEDMAEDLQTAINKAPRIRHVVCIVDTTFTLHAHQCLLTLALNVSSF
jgi:hypothetical protein